MIRRIDIKNEIVASEILILQKKSYKIEADIIGYYQIPPMLESLGELVTSQEHFLVYEKFKKIVGMISYEIENQVLTICRLAVDPDHFREKIANQLLHEVLQVKDIISISVSTGLENKPAVEFYLKQGFTKTNVTKIDGLSILHLQRLIEN